MKIRRNSEVFERRAVRFAGGRVNLIDQRALPFGYSEMELRDAGGVGEAIRDMVVRGAPSIGVAAAYGMLLGINAMEPGLDTGGFEQGLETIAELLDTRPTARELRYACAIIADAALEGWKSGGPEEARRDALQAARRYDDGIVDACRLIGVHGAELLGGGSRVLTHCNAGALASQDIGTALAPIRQAVSDGAYVFVYVDETRPRNQGAMLSAWELANEGIEHRIIADNAAGHYMQRKQIDLVIVGADRIAANGDVANKIGTLEKAVLANHFGIPFYVAAPWSTFDPDTASGDDIPIEERDEEEVLTIPAASPGVISHPRCSEPRSRGLNPAFDVTPAELVTGYITQDGVLEPEQVRKRLGSEPHGLPETEKIP